MDKPTPLARAGVPAGPAAVTPAPTRALTAPEFQQLAQVPATTEWFANLDNPNTRRAYRSDLKEFMGFVGLQKPEELRRVTRARPRLARRSRAPGPGRIVHSPQARRGVLLV